MFFMFQTKWFKALNNVVDYDTKLGLKRKALCDKVIVYETTDYDGKTVTSTDKELLYFLYGNDCMMKQKTVLVPKAEVKKLLEEE